MTILLFANPPSERSYSHLGLVKSLSGWAIGGAALPILYNSIRMRPILSKPVFIGLWSLVAVGAGYKAYFWELQQYQLLEHKKDLLVKLRMEQKEKEAVL